MKSTYQIRDQVTCLHGQTNIGRNRGQERDDAMAQARADEYNDSIREIAALGHRLIVQVKSQHRYEAMSDAFDAGIDEYHGVKVYLALNTKQRLDVQLISNTNIAVSPDLFDRMQETVRGPNLRDWCYAVGLLEEGIDFADKHRRGGPISVQMARTFIVNFYRGQQIAPEDFEKSNVIPPVCKKGQHDSDWDELTNDRPDL